MQNTPSLNDTVPATDRTTLEWAYKGFDLLGPALLDLSRETKDEETAIQLFMLVVALAEASNKLEDYLAGATATITTETAVN